MSDSAKVRFVRCPKCQNLLHEPIDYSIYECGGCGAVLLAKHKGYVCGSLSDDGKVGVGDSGKSESSLEKGLVDRSDAKPQTEMESVRFSTSKYPDEGPSNGFSSKYMGSWRNRNEADGADMVQHLEQDRAELQRKLDELKVHPCVLTRPLDASVCPPSQLSSMASLGTALNSFAWTVDSAIRSSSGSSGEETFPVRSFASVVDRAINSDSAEDVEEDFMLFTRTEIVATATDNFSVEVENTIKKSVQDCSWSNHTGDPSLLNVVTVNGKPMSNFNIKKAEKIAGPIQPGNYWYDFRGGFWGVMGGPCLGIIPPFIEEFNHPLPHKCSGGNTDVYVNGRELHQKDLDLLAGKGLPTDRDRSYIIEISGKVFDAYTGEESNSLGQLAPVVEKMKHGFGMAVPLFQLQRYKHETRAKYKGYVAVNGKRMSNPVINRAEKLAGIILPGKYWYDFRGGFWGVMGGPCLGIIPPFIEEFNLPMPYKCCGGNTGVYVNGRELHQKDLDLLAKRGLPKDRDRSYIIEISGRVLNEDTGEELLGLGKLAPTMERRKRGFGMKVPSGGA